MSSNGHQDSKVAIPFDRKNTILLIALLHSNTKQRQFIITHADNELIRAICEIALNILNGNIVLDKITKKKFEKYKLVLRRLATKNNWRSKKQIIIKYCITTILTLLITIISDDLLKNLR